MSNVMAVTSRDMYKETVRILNATGAKIEVTLKTSVTQDYRKEETNKDQQAIITKEIQSIKDNKEIKKASEHEE
jgi:hypothetical protein